MDKEIEQELNEKIEEFYFKVLENGDGVFLKELKKIYKEYGCVPSKKDIEEIKKSFEKFKELLKSQEIEEMKKKKKENREIEIEIDNFYFKLLEKGDYDIDVEFKNFFEEKGVVISKEEITACKEAFEYFKKAFEESGEEIEVYKQILNSSRLLDLVINNDIDELDKEIEKFIIQNKGKPSKGAIAEIRELLFLEKEEIQQTEEEEKRIAIKTKKKIQAEVNKQTNVTRKKEEQNLKLSKEPTLAKDNINKGIQENIEYLISLVESKDNHDWEKAVKDLGLDMTPQSLRRAFRAGRYSGYAVAKAYLSVEEDKDLIKKEEIELMVRGVETKDKTIIAKMIKKLNLDTTVERSIASFNRGRYSGYYIAKYFQDKKR